MIKICHYNIHAEPLPPARSLDDALPPSTYASNNVLFLEPNTPLALYANADTNNQAINTRMLPHRHARTHARHQRLSPLSKGGGPGDSRIDPTNDDEPLDNVAPLEPFRHASAVRPIRERRRRRGANQEQDLPHRPPGVLLSQRASK